MKYLLPTIFCLISISYCQAQLSFNVPQNNPVELGKVNWLRNYDQAIAKAKSEKKPVFILFQEVPGCATCRNFGNDVLTHPFLVEMIESHFIPLAIFNNVKGHDREILNQFNEPTWNNPVIRIIDARGKDIVQRLGRDWTELGVAGSIRKAMEIEGKHLPKYFELYQDELIGRSGPIKEAHLAMYCFWTGEKELAKIDGILSTEPGFMNGREVVKVEYNPYATSLEKIVPIAEKANCADEVYFDQKVQLDVPVKSTSRYRKDKDDKYYLSRTAYKVIPMTPLQAAKVNSAIGQGLSPNQLLSPRQVELFNYLKNNSINNIGADFSSRWYQILP